MSLEVTSHNTRSRKRKLESLEAKDAVSTPNVTSFVVLNLCHECRADIPRFKAAFKDRVFLRRATKLSSRVWPASGPESQCPLCRLLFDASEQGYRKEGSNPKRAVFSIIATSYMYTSGEAPRAVSTLHTALWEEDIVCLVVKANKNLPTVDTSVALTAALDGSESACLLPALLDDAHNYEVQQKRGKYDPCMVYAARIVDAQRVDYSLVSSWIRTCKKVHQGRCRSRAFNVRPRIAIQETSIWLIDCRSRCVVEGTLMEQFVTLSYVWGLPTGKSLPKSLWSQRPNARLPENLPRVIEDAIAVTSNLGYNYLWVDQCCIDQEGGQHKLEQMAIMDLIYGASDLTIIAASGQDASYGLPGVNMVPRTEQPRLAIDPELVLVSPLSRPENLVHISKWASRGWTYQEGILAKRRLVFTDQQVYFECNCISTWESLRRPLATICSGKTKSIVPGIRAGYFMNHCQLGRNYRHDGKRSVDRMFAEGLDTYLSRKLTFERDILDAFKGYLEALYPGHNAFGLPLCYLQDDRKIARERHRLRESNEMTIALARALGWRHGVAPTMRRPGWPSFTWTGWTNVPNMEPWGSGIDSQISFPGLDWTKLVNDTPESLTVEACTSALYLNWNPQLASGIIPLRVQGRERWHYDIEIPEMAFSDDGEDHHWKVEILLLSESCWPVKGRFATTGFNAILFKRMTDGSIERTGHFMCRSTRNNGPIERESFEALMDQPLVRETVKLK